MSRDQVPATLLRSLQTSARSDGFQFRIAFSSSLPGNIISCSFLRSLHHSDNSSGLALQYLRLGIVEPLFICSAGILPVCMQCVGWAIDHGLATAGLAREDKKTFQTFYGG